MSKIRVRLVLYDMCMYISHNKVFCRFSAKIPNKERLTPDDVNVWFQLVPKRDANAKYRIVRRGSRLYPMLRLAPNERLV